MSYLEELLPEFRKGAKIRCDYWDEGKYIQLKEDNYIYDNEDDRIELSSLTIFGKSWELYQEPFDWDYIIKNKCLCYFWDGSGDYKTLGILIKVNENSTLCRYHCKKSNGDYYQYANCRPVRRDEVTFYEEQSDE
jgi:hypothetical protein